MRSNPNPEQLAAQRTDMVEHQLACRGIRHPAVLGAMGRVPRERFMPPELADRAYEDSALGIACGQTISQPYMVARMTELLDPGPDDHVLEIGTGSGYQTAVLAELVGHVCTIEWHLRLMTEAAERLNELGISNVSFRCGDGTRGWPERAPFDGILVTAGGPVVPTALREQLAVGGRMVIPVGPLDDQTLLVIRRTPDGFETIEDLKCRFVKLVGAEGWEPH